MHLWTSFTIFTHRVYQVQQKERITFSGQIQSIRPCSRPSWPPRAAASWYSHLEKFCRWFGMIWMSLPNLPMAVWYSMMQYVILAEAVLHDCRNLSHGIQPLAAFTAPRDSLHTVSWRSKAAMVMPCCRAFRSSLLSLPSQPVFTQHFGRNRQEVPNQLRSNTFCGQWPFYWWPTKRADNVDTSVGVLQSPMQPKGSIWTKVGVSLSLVNHDHVQCLAVLDSGMIVALVV
jgi:hypothetical protein